MTVSHKTRMKSRPSNTERDPASWLAMNDSDPETGRERLQKEFRVSDWPNLGRWAIMPVIRDGKPSTKGTLPTAETE